jgi:hypothetical protein
MMLAGFSACSKYDLRQSMRRAERSFDKLTEKFKQQPPENALPVAPLPEPPAKAAKPAGHAKASTPAAEEADPQPEPTQEELVEYVRGKLLTLSPSDGFNDNVEVRFDPSTSTLTVIQPISRCDLFMSALDASNITWDTFDPSDDQNARPVLLRLTTASVSGKKARACFDVRGQPEEGTSTNRVRLLFSLAKAEQLPGFQERMTKTMKALILLSGGVEGKEFFPDSQAKPHSKNK